MNIVEVRYRYAQTFDEDWARDLVSELTQHDVWVTPTLAVLRQIEQMGQVDHEQHPFRKYIFPGIWQTWDPKVGRRRALTDEELKQAPLVNEKTAALIKLMQKGGVGLLAGSDSGASNNYTFPAWTLHRELQLLVESGVSPMEALQAATRNPARFLGELPRNGTVEEGKTANLVLLTTNPLEDIRNTQKIDSVVLKREAVNARESGPAFGGRRDESGGCDGALNATEGTVQSGGRETHWKTDGAMLDEWSAMRKLTSQFESRLLKAVSDHRYEISGWAAKLLKDMVARDGVELPDVLITG